MNNAQQEFRMEESAINSIVVSNASVPDQEVGHDSSPSHFGTSKGRVLDYSVDGAQEEGLRLIVAENYLEVRKVSLNRLKRKSDVGLFTLEKVEEMKTQSLTTVGSEK